MARTTSLKETPSRWWISLATASGADQVATARSSPRVPLNGVAGAKTPAERKSASPAVADTAVPTVCAVAPGMGTFRTRSTSFWTPPRAGTAGEGCGCQLPLGSGSSSNTISVWRSPARPSSIAWWAFMITATRPPPSPSTKWFSQSGRSRSIGLDMIQPASSLSSRSPPGVGRASWIRWRSGSKAASWTHRIGPRPKGSWLRRWRSRGSRSSRDSSRRRYCSKVSVPPGRVEGSKIEMPPTFMCTPGDSMDRKAASSGVRTWAILGRRYVRAPPLSGAGGPARVGPFGLKRLSALAGDGDQGPLDGDRHDAGRGGSALGEELGAGAEDHLAPPERHLGIDARVDLAVGGADRLVEPERPARQRPRLAGVDPVEAAHPGGAGGGGVVGAPGGRGDGRVVERVERRRAFEQVPVLVGVLDLKPGRGVEAKRPGAEETGRRRPGQALVEARLGLFVGRPVGVAGRHRPVPEDVGEHGANGTRQTADTNRTRTPLAESKATGRSLTPERLSGRTSFWPGVSRVQAVPSQLETSAAQADRSQAELSWRT